MRMNPAIQFRGYKNALDAYTKMDIAPWALFCGNQLLMRSTAPDIETGAAEFEEYCKMMLRNNNPQARYTLCVYEYLSEGARITNKTEYSASFNFTLQDYDSETNTSPEIARLKARIEELESEPDEPQDGIAGMLNGFLQHPKIQEAIINRVMGFVNSILAPAEVAKVAGLTPLPGGQYQQTNYQPQPTTMPEQTQDISQTDLQERLNAALNKLYQHDNNIVEHLEKLSIIAESKPDMFNMLVGMLKNY